MALTLSHGGDTIFSTTSRSEEVLVGTKEGIVFLKRNVGGPGWRIARRALADKHIHAVIIEPDSGAIIAGVTEDTIYISEDNGETWERRDDGITQHDIYSLAAAKVNGKTRIFAGTQPAHLFYSDDLGRHWTELTALRSVDTSDKEIRDVYEDGSSSGGGAYEVTVRASYKGNERVAVATVDVE